MLLFHRSPLDASHEIIFRFPASTMTSPPQSRPGRDADILRDVRERQSSDRSMGAAMTRLLGCGSREWPGTYGEIRFYMGRAIRDFAVSTVIHGRCSRYVGGCQVSADMLIDLAADCFGLTREPYPVDHALDGPWPKAGPRRNARMLRVGRPARGLAFGALWKPPVRVLVRGTPFKKTGTGDMVSLMLAARLPVRWIAAPGAPGVDLTEMPKPDEGMR